MQTRWTWLVAAMTAACSSSGGVTADAPAPIADAAIDAGPPAGAAAAATTTATTNPACVAIAPFYWEIGDATQVLASGSTGDLSVTRTTQLGIASASKWIFGMYVAQRLGAGFDATARRYLTMTAGYTSFTSCLGTTTVQACTEAGSNGTYTAANDGSFAYGGGHFQHYAVELGLGALTNATLAAEIGARIGSPTPFAYSTPQLAGGVRSSAAGYAQLLQAILAGRLAIRDRLGEAPVCTLPGTCPTAIRSPALEAFHYSVGHWVEDDPAHGDGAFSSPGAFGFYPWIDATRTYYGVVSRQALTSAGEDAPGGPGWESLLCGRELRKAFMTGVAR